MSALKINSTFLYLTILFISLYFCGIAHSQTNKLHKQINEATTLAHNYPDSAIVLLNKYYKTSLKIKNDTLQSKCLTGLISANHIIQNYSAAFDYVADALTLAKKVHDTLLLTKVLEQNGMLNIKFNQKEKTIASLKKSLLLKKEAFQKGQRTPHQLISSYYQLSICFNQFKEYTIAQHYLDSCYNISDTIKHGAVNRAYLDAQKGIIALNKSQLQTSIASLNKAASVFEQIDTTADSNSTKGYLSVIYSHLGEAYRKAGNKPKAFQTLTKALINVNTYKRFIEHKALILERFAWLEFEQGAYKNAFTKLNQAYKINEKYFSTKAISNKEFLTVRDKYAENLAKKDEELLKTNLEIAQKEHSISQFKTYLFVIFLLLLLGGILTRSLIQKRNYEREKKANLIAEKEAEKLLKQKNKELTVSTLKIIEKEIIIKSLSEHLEQFPKDDTSKTLLNSAKQNNANLWEDFNKRFISVNSDFYDKLLVKIPNLTSSDLKVCALIKLNFSGKEMAHLLGISVDSVHKARHRLRKKINLTRDANLANFITSI